MSFGLFLVVVTYLLSRHNTILDSLREDWAGLLLWAVLIVVVNFFPVWLGEITFTLDMPLLISLALLYPPEVATFGALLFSLDIRELTGGVSLARAIFNRAQVAVGVLAAAQVFRAISSGLRPWTTAVLATLVAIAVSYVVNVLLVAFYTHLRQHAPLARVIQSLTRGRLVEFGATYAGYCGLAIVLAYLFRDVGGWSVALFLIPTIVAQQMLVRGQRLQAATEQLKRRERLLERSFDRVVDERRDERLRIAGDLHDEVLGTLTKVLMQAKASRDDPEDRRSDAGPMQRLLADAEHAMVALRDVISDLRKSPLGRGGLLATLRGLIADLRLDWGAKIHLQTHVSTNLRPETQVVAYQVAREGLTNALKHAKASEIWVSLSETDTQLVIEVTDDGLGFRMVDVDPSLHFGLGLMRERVRTANGTFSLKSGLGEGTILTVSLPTRRHMPSEEWIRRARRIAPAGLTEQSRETTADQP